jgi:hypothetical protein
MAANGLIGINSNIQNTMVYMRYTTVTRDAQTRQLFASHRVV